MTSRTRLIVGSVLALAALGTEAPRARACTGSSCAPERFLPFVGSLPANAPGIYWVPGRDDFGTSALDDLEMRCTGQGGVGRTIELEAEPVGGFGAQLLTPTTPLVAGEQCMLEGRTTCGYTDAYLNGRSMLSITEEAPLPATLGTLSAADAEVAWVEASTTEGSCSVMQSACVAEVSLTLSEDAMPWRDALELTTLIDGGEWWVLRDLSRPNITGGSSVGRGRDVIFAWMNGAENASDAPGLPAGVYSVRMTATLPGSDVVLETEEITIELRCDDDRPVQSRDGGADDGDGGGDGDAAAEGNEPLPNPMPVSINVPKDDSGDCSASGAHDSTLGWLVLASLVLARRRKHGELETKRARGVNREPVLRRRASLSRRTCSTRCRGLGTRRRSARRRA